jgi:hypothetical protein
VGGRFEWNSAPDEKTLFWFEKNGFQVIRNMMLMPNGKDYEITLQRIGITNKATQPASMPKLIYKFDQPPGQ